MKNEYRDLMAHIQKPKGLNERVLRAAEKATVAAERHVPARPEKKPLWNRPVFQMAACAACAAALLLGSMAAFKPTGTTMSNFSFGVVAYAADTGTLIQPQDSKIAFALANSGSSDPQNGSYTGCLFRVTGENIQTVSATIDKGGLYRMKTVSVDRTTAQGAAACTALLNGESPAVEGCDVVSGYSEDEKLFYFDACWSLGTSFAEEYDAETSYGFWVPPADVNSDPEADMQQAAHDEIDRFDGAVLQLKVTFTNGSEQTKTLALHTGKLAVTYREDVNGPVLTGELAKEGEPYSYGIYADIA